MIRLLKAIFIVVPKLIFWYFQWILIYYIRRNKIPFEKKYNKIRSCVLTVLKDLNIELLEDGIENVKYDENKSNFYVCNHQSLLDPLFLVLLLKRPLSFVSKKEASHYPFIGKAVKLLECKFLDRNDLKQQVKVILDVKKSLNEKQRDWCIYPEGRRNKNPFSGLLEYHHGSFKLLNESTDMYVFTLFGTFRPLQFFKYPNKKLVVQLCYTNFHSYDELKDLTSTKISEIVSSESLITYNKLKEKDKEIYNLNS